MRRGCPRITALWSLWLLTCQLIELIIHSYSMQTFIHTKNHQIEHSYNFAINFDLQHFAAMLRVHKSLFSDDKFSSVASEYGLKWGLGQRGFEREGHPFRCRRWNFWIPNSTIILSLLLLAVSHDTHEHNTAYCSFVLLFYLVSHIMNTSNAFIASADFIGKEERVEENYSAIGDTLLF